MASSGDTDEFKDRNAARACIEGILSQETRTMTVCCSRYARLYHEQLGHVATDAAINVMLLAKPHGRVPSQGKKVERQRDRMLPLYCLGSAIVRLCLSHPGRLTTLAMFGMHHMQNRPALLAVRYPPLVDVA